MKLSKSHVINTQMLIKFDLVKKTVLHRAVVGSLKLNIFTNNLYFLTKSHLNVCISSSVTLNLNMIIKSKKNYGCIYSISNYSFKNFKIDCTNSDFILRASDVEPLLKYF